MNAIELKFKNRKGTGFWYCSLCFQTQTQTRPDHDSWNYRSKFKIWRDHGDSKWNRKLADECCSPREFRGVLCTGCRTPLKSCKCGRAHKNLCTGCGKKLWLREGEVLKFGDREREFCRECADNLHAKLADAGK